MAELTIAPVATHGFYVDGKWVEDGDIVEVRAPYDGNVIARVVQGRRERELRPPLDVDKGTVVDALVAERTARGEPLRTAAAFGDDVGDLPAFAALQRLHDAGGPLRHAVRVAAVDAESPPAVAAAADLTVDGALGAVALLREIAAAAAAAGSAQR